MLKFEFEDDGEATVLYIDMEDGMLTVQMQCIVNNKVTEACAMVLSQSEAEQIIAFLCGHKAD